MFEIFKQKPNKELVAYLLFIIAIFLILQFNVVPMVIAGLLAYVLTRKILNFIEFKIPKNKTHAKIVGFTVGVVSLGSLVVLGFILSKVLSGENINDLIQTIIETLNKSRGYLPGEVAALIPENIHQLKMNFAQNIKSHVFSFANFGKDAAYSLILVVVGWLIGILIACQKPTEEYTLFSRTWSTLWLKLSSSFKFVVFAQVKVAAFNSFFMMIFLFVIAPVMGWEIPYSKMLVLITFICGLLPIIGNLISNTITFILALTVSFPAAMTSLLFLVVIHKLEYFIISKSLGADIDSDVWELLIVLFTFEILFGLAGMVFSPILYAFVKLELRRHNWLLTPKRQDVVTKNIKE